LSLAFAPGAVTAQWIEQNAGFSTPGLEVFSMDAVDESVVWAVAGDVQTLGPVQEFTRTTDGGSTWVSGTVTGATGLFANSISALDASTAWASFADLNYVLPNKIFKTTNGGTTWVHQATAFPAAGSFVNAVHLFDANNGVAVGDPVGGYFEIYTTTNGGTNWVRVPQANIPAPQGGEFPISGIFGTLGSTIWFGTYNPSQARVYRSTDRGVTWTMGSTGLGPNTFVGGIAFRDGNNGLAKVITNVPTGNPHWVVRTTNGGDTWTALAPPVQPYTQVIAWVPGTATYMVTSFSTAGGGGSTYTADNGASWTLVDQVPHMAVDFVSPNVGWCGGVTRAALGQGPEASAQAPSAGHFAMFKDPAFLKRHFNRHAVAGDFHGASGGLRPQAATTPDALRAATVGGMWKWAGITLAVNEASPVLPEGRLSHRSYPNPFNPAALIEFTLPETSHANLRIYNSAGRELATLLNRSLGEGRHVVRWDAAGLGSGVYFYRLEAGGTATSGQMVLAK
jgi:hypothetical protein